MSPVDVVVEAMKKDVAEKLRRCSQEVGCCAAAAPGDEDCDS